MIFLIGNEIGNDSICGLFGLNSTSFKKLIALTNISKANGILWNFPSKYVLLGP
jgi:hypothetical protein